MVDIVTQKQPAREVWLHQLTDSVTNPTELLAILGLEQDENWRAGTDARRLFALRVPRPFIAKMEKGNPRDPLLLQTMTHRAEFDLTPGFSDDPLDEQHSVVPGLLHKYHNRALLLVKGGCAVNCRYCFPVTSRMRTIKAPDITGSRRSIISLTILNSMKSFSPAVIR